MSEGVSAYPPPPTHHRHLVSLRRRILETRPVSTTRRCCASPPPPPPRHVPHVTVILLSGRTQFASSNTVVVVVVVQVVSGVTVAALLVLGESDSKRVLDAFFLGKALAEALNERIESAVGEFLSTVGRLQAEQQKQVQDFQEEVLEKAKRAKKKAAREAMEAQGLICKSPTSNITTFSNGVTMKAAPLSTEQQSVLPSSSNSSTLTANKDENSTDSDPLVGISIDN